jgi:DNA-binding MarR family transcriptional regulator
MWFARYEQFAVCEVLTDDRGTSLNPKAKAIERIMRSQRQMTHAFASARSEPLLAANLTMSQLKALLVLADHDAASAHELADALRVGLATLTGIVDRLVAHGLVVRREDPHDRRVRRVVLTVAGRELVDAIIMAGAELQRRLLERLEPAQLAIVEQATELMLGAAAQEAEATGSTSAAAAPVSSTPTSTAAGTTALTGADASVGAPVGRPR